MELILSNQEFAYELQSLIKAFYPSEAIRMNSENTDTVTGIRIIVAADETKACFSFFEDNVSIMEKSRSMSALSRRGYKNQLKLLVYECLTELTGRKLVWGTLTGVRPTKMILELLEQGETDQDIAVQMKENYRISDEKLAIGLHITKKEFSLLDRMDYKKGYSIYIGIPFCPTTCLYCSFASYSLKQYGVYTDPYLEALFREIEYGAACFKKLKLTTVYVGGGTPTSLTEPQLERLLEKITKTLDFSSVLEFTVEAGRPDSITPEKLRLLKMYGVTRISINPQSMNQVTLDVIGRKHTTAEVQEAFVLAREAGHDNINMDLIVGLPGETLKDVEHTLLMAEKLNPDSVTIHSLAVKRAAALKLQMDKYADIEHYNVEAMVISGERFAVKNGYEPYYLYRQKNTTGSKMSSRENVGYARPGKEGLYNILIMEEKQTILALGAGGTSKFVYHDTGRMERVENVKFVKDYVERIDEMILRKKNFIEGAFYE